MFLSYAKIYVTVSVCPEYVHWHGSLVCKTRVQPTHGNMIYSKVCIPPVGMYQEPAGAWYFITNYITGHHLFKMSHSCTKDDRITASVLKGTFMLHCYPQLSSQFAHWKVAFPLILETSLVPCLTRSVFMKCEWKCLDNMLKSLLPTTPPYPFQPTIDSISLCAHTCTHAHTHTCPHTHTHTNHSNSLLQRKFCSIYLAMLHSDTSPICWLQQHVVLQWKYSRHPLPLLPHECSVYHNPTL